MKSKHLCSYLTLLSLVFAGYAHAHHSVGTRVDQNKFIEIRGVVIDFKLRSPHSSLLVDGLAFVDGVPQSGDVKRWEIESLSLPGLRRMGVEADTFKPGDSITVVAAPNRKADFRFVHATTFITADERVFGDAAIAPGETPSSDSVSEAAGAGVVQLPGRDGITDQLNKSTYPRFRGLDSPQDMLLTGILWSLGIVVLVLVARAWRSIPWPRSQAPLPARWSDGISTRGAHKAAVPPQRSFLRQPRRRRCAYWTRYPYVYLCEISISPLLITWFIAKAVGRTLLPRGGEECAAPYPRLH